MSSLTYEQSGVDYGPLDAFKRACQRQAAATASALASHNITEPAGTRGESAYLIETPDAFWAHVEEGLGTKNLVADAMAKLTGQTHYHSIGIDTVATIVNDLITCGALPISVAMHAAVGDSNWFADTARADELARGFADGCRQANAVWGGGETPALKGMVTPDSIILAGSAFGRIAPKSHRITGDIRDGDQIILLASSGVQTNGLTLCRALAERLPQGYLTPISDGRTYGQALLDPSAIYVNFIAACQKANLRLHYAAHLTGHGWRKLMRLNEPFVYRMTHLGHPQPIFDTIRQAAQMDLREAYATFNMGAGFAVWVSAADAQTALQLATQSGHTAWIGGTTHKQSTRKAVELVPLDIAYESDTLQVR
ncbi:MAG: phosphoribosylformylglycinamidine cyclo-ligase [Phycisphaerales bacterium]|nr:phosphoribosylformylglycinamidine cyclo-ligase [Phycisphaerales bacterium]